MESQCCEFLRLPRVFANPVPSIKLSGDLGLDQRSEADQVATESPE
jgi:hypothetical protein